MVTVDKAITPSFIKGMSEGVRILGSMTLPCKLKQVGPRTFHIILTEGKNRQIRRMCEAFGYSVLKLKRIRIMNILLDDLAKGKWRNLTEDEKTVLFNQIHYEPQH